MLTEIRTSLETLIRDALQGLSLEQGQSPVVSLEMPADKQHGEFACNVAMRLAGIFKKNPLELAETIKGLIESRLAASALKDSVAAVEVKRPGFINFRLTPAAFAQVLVQIGKEATAYGRSRQGAGKKVQIEFVSANPTGPLSVAHARQAAVGDALANLFNFAGFDAKKEFYVNDEGNQINILGRSIRDRGREILGESFSFPEDNYQGDYIRDLARKFMDLNGVRSPDDLNKVLAGRFSQFGVDELMAVIQQELKDFGVHFDIWSHQSKIAPNDRIDAVLKLLRDRGYIYDQEGAVWFKSTALGDDKDRVVKKSDGNYTYLSPDIVYHQDKFDRGFTQLINIWGPDHHGYIPRITAAVAALGHDPKSLNVLIVQLATIFRNGQPLSMSTRRGQYISLREVLDEVGADAARFFFLMRHIKAHLEFDLELAKKQTPENPVFYIQYAHARVCSVIALGLQSQLTPLAEGFQLLKEPEELDLMKQLGVFPDTILACCYQYDPFAMTVYLQELATLFHKFYDKHRVVSEDAALSRERLGLISAVRTVLANGLHLIGVSAPEKM